MNGIFGEDPPISDVQFCASYLVIRLIFEHARYPREGVFRRVENIGLQYSLICELIKMAVASSTE